VVKLSLRLTKKSTNYKIFNALVTVAILYGIAKVGAIAKELVVAWRFGTLDEMDAFLIAFLVPSFVINVVAGSFNTAFMPTYIRVRKQEGDEASQRLLSSVMIWGVAISAVTAVIVIVTSHFYLPVLASGFSQDKLNRARELLVMISPVIVFSGISTIWSAVLNAGERFALASLTPAATPVVTIILLLTVGINWGIYSLALGIVLGTAIEIIILGTAIKRERKRIDLKWYGFDDNFIQVAKQYVPMVAGAFLMSSTTLVDQSMAAMLEPGSVAALNYGNKLVAFTISLGTMALGTAILPYFSNMIADNDWIGVRHTLKTYTVLVLLATIPVVIVMVHFSGPLVSLIYQRGAFTESDTRLVSVIQVMYALQIPFYMMATLFIRLLSSMNYNYILMLSAVISLPLDIVLNYLLMRYMGVAGIALSTSLVYVISCGFLAIMSCKLMWRAGN